MTTKKKNISTYFSIGMAIVAVVSSIFGASYYAAVFIDNVNDLTIQQEQLSNKIDILSEKMLNLYSICEQAKILRQLGLDGESDGE